MRFMFVTFNLWLIVGAVIAPIVTPTTLIITIRDEAARGIAGVEVNVIGTKNQRIGHGVTSATGLVEFRSLPDTQVRIQLNGQRVDGIPLYLPDADLGGLVVNLHPPAVTLDLRVETDGMVRPDPATMITPDMNELLVTAIPERDAMPTPSESASVSEHSAVSAFGVGLLIVLVLAVTFTTITILGRMR